MSSSDPAPHTDAAKPQAYTDAAAQPGLNKLTVKVFSPYQIFYNGEADSVSAVNQTGPFDVLAQHASFFSILTPSDVMVRNADKQQSFRVERGVIKVDRNSVTVFMNI